MRHSVRPRPALLRALGPCDPPHLIHIAGVRYERVGIFKHDSWAATAHYRGPQGDVVCKFNRVQGILGVPMAWLGRLLARREAAALRRLAGVPGIPAESGPVIVDGAPLANAVAHEYVPGQPLSARDKPAPAFFADLAKLLRAVHQCGMAYVDLHKRENILVGTDGRPWLIDFQVCFHARPAFLRRHAVVRALLHGLQQGDRYHFAKHVHKHQPELAGQLPECAERPAWINAHRVIAQPLRRLRRQLLTLLGVRAGKGRATSEAFAEDAVRRDLEHAA